MRHLSLPVWLLALLVVGSGSAPAQVTAPVNNNHGTVVVNGAAGDAVVNGGLLRGGNLFQRLQNLDTTPINKLQFLTKTNTSQSDLANPVLVKNLFLSVLTRAIINKPVSVESQEGATGVNLYMLSPNGITINGAGSFTGVNTLLLTTASKFDLGDGTVYAVDTADADIAAAGFEFDSSAVRGLAQTLATQFKEAQAAGGGFFADNGAGVSIEIGSGVQLEVARSLFLVSNQAPIKIGAASLIAKGNQAGTVISSTTTVNHTGDAANAIAPADADGIAVVGRDIEMIGTSLKSNSQFLIREPLAQNAPGQGVLASPIVESYRWNGTAAYVQGGDTQPRRDTLSSIKLRNVLIAEADSAVASSWGGVVNMLGFGNRNGQPVNGAVAYNPPTVPPGTTVVAPVDTVDLGADSYLGGYAPLNPATLSSTGRLAYRGLRIDGLTIRPTSSSITSVGVTIGNDWGFARDLIVDTRSQTALIKRELRFVQGYRADAAAGSVAGGEALTVNAPLWNLGKINSLTDSANAYVSYVARWWDGGDVTNNNITIAYLSTPVPVSGGDSSPPPVVVLPPAPAPAPVPAPAVPAAPAPAPVLAPAPAPTPVPAPPQASNPTPSPAVTAATAASFDQVLFNFDQTVFSDADATAGVGSTPAAGTPGTPGVQSGVTLNVSLDSPAGISPSVQPASSAGGSQPASPEPANGAGTGSDSSGNNNKSDQDDEEQKQGKTGNPSSPVNSGNAPQVR